jgi:hypothetical protein
MSYFQITAKCEEVDESSYTVQSTGEVVTTIQLSLVVPSMRERVLCELPLELAPKPDILRAPGARRVMASRLGRCHACASLHPQQCARGREDCRLYAKPEISDSDEVIDAELEAEDLPHIHSVRKAFHWAGRIWQYLTAKGLSPPQAAGVESRR